MKIILVHNTYQRPGGEDVVFDQERLLLEAHGHDVVAYRRSNWEVERYKGVKLPALAWRTVWSENTRKEFRRLLAEHRPDLVHIHNTFVMISPSIYSACLEAGVPVVQTLHNYRLSCPAATFYRDGRVCEECREHSLWRSVRYGCYRDSRPATAVVALTIATHRQLGTWTQGVNCFVALSEFSRRKFIESGLPPGRIFVKPNFVYPDPNARPGQGRYALFVGRLSPEKRVDTVLAAWSRLCSSIPLVVVGGGPELLTLKKTVDALGVSEVRFLGQLSRQSTLDVIKAARFLIFSSEWYENFPMTIAEAFACGIPVICSRLGAMQEIVDHGRIGLQFSPGNPAELADLVAWAWGHPEDMKAMGDEARREYEKKYTAEANYPKLMEIYRHALTPVGDAAAAAES
ncbi:MAG TPA: glycosyltransferase family 4 protein [Terriglobia bacterium]|jgi:glycosyltransferase involved in cell wall biosynthesis|nr:glycosyltransferase family 4 protein [Terriglobia bacterium]